MPKFTMQVKREVTVTLNKEFVIQADDEDEARDILKQQLKSDKTTTGGNEGWDEYDTDWEDDIDEIDEGIDPNDLDEEDEEEDDDAEGE